MKKIKQFLFKVFKKQILEATKYERPQWIVLRSTTILREQKGGNKQLNKTIQEAQIQRAKKDLLVEAEQYIESKLVLENMLSSPETTLHLGLHIVFKGKR